MKKVMLLAAMLAMVLVAAAPAFAQVATDDSVAVDNSSTVTYEATCQNVIGSITTGDAAQYGDATAVATDDSAAAAEVAAELDTSVDVVNECLNAEGVTVTGGSVVHSSSSASSASSSSASSSGAATLPDTGGVSLITLGAGALLVAGGLLARRIVR